MKRIEFTKQKIPFTQVANGVLQNKNISFKAKGLYAYLYSKPDGWDFSIDRISLETKEHRRAINGGLQELERNGYLKRIKQGDGRVVYSVFYPPAQMSETNIRVSEPDAQNSKVLKQQSAKTSTISNKDIKVIKSNSNKECTALSLGEFQNVEVTEEEYRKLKETIENPEDLIEELSGYLAASGKRYKSHYAVIKNWSRRKSQERSNKNKSFSVIGEK